MLLEMIEALRNWERHCTKCQRCAIFDTAIGPADVINKEPCGVGRALLLNLLHILQKGL